MTWQEQRIRDRFLPLSDERPHATKDEIELLLRVIDHYREATKGLREFMRVYGNDGLGIEVGDPVWDALQKLVKEEPC